MFNRRTVSSGLAALGLAPLTAHSAGREIVQGATTWSESAMVLYFDAEVRNGFSVRISRYPDNDATWVWCHLLLEGQLYTFTDHRVPCGSAHTDPNAPVATYPSPGLNVSITRLGSSADMKGLSFKAQIKAHQNASGVDGPGDTPVALEGVFQPGPLRAGSPPGRFERTGVMKATLSVGRKAVSLTGLGKAHEQTQTAPRFTAPFTYAMLWGPSASLVGLMSPARKYGDLELDGKDTDLASFQVERWAPTRRFAAILQDGTRVDGKAETVQRFEVPVFGQQWYGRIVRAEVAGKPMVGMVNDWRPADQPYGLS